MTTLAELTDEVLTNLTSYGLVQPRVTWLAASVSDADTEFRVDDVAGLSRGVAEIGDETVYVRRVDPSGTAYIAPDGRGWAGTTASAHVAGDRLTFAPVWPRTRVKSAVNDIIENLWPDVWGVGETSFTYNPSVSTYVVPEDCEGVLEVAHETNGPSKEWVKMARWRLDARTTTSFDTGKSLTLYSAPTPGRTVHVVYRKRPTRLAEGESLTDAGLAESAKLAVVYGACAQLASYLDTARLPVNAAEADELDKTVEVGMASRVAGNLYARHREEVERERKRLQVATPTVFNIAKGRVSLG